MGHQQWLIRVGCERLIGSGLSLLFCLLRSLKKGISAFIQIGFGTLALFVKRVSSNNKCGISLALGTKIFERDHFLTEV